LMIAYRLHFEDLTLQAIDLVRRGRIGEPRFLNSLFSMTVRADNIRTKRDYGGGSVYDIGVYCINAARMLFGAEPREVLAMSVHSGAPKLAEVDETTGALLRFDDGRLAAFVTSFNAADVGSLRIVGTKGDLRLDPAYEYAEGLAGTLTVNGKATRVRGRKRDQFAPELLYFSDCILTNQQPEPSGAEGLQDVRIIRAIYESAEIGKPIAIPPIVEPQPSKSQRISRPAVKKPTLVRVASASEE
jgi:predicted dehydrogenase